MPEPPPPPRPQAARPPLTARPAVAADYASFVRLAPELGVDDPLPDAGVWALSLAKTTLLFEEDGAVVAYAYFQVMGDVGYVRHVVVDPAHRSRGVGRAVMDTLAARLREAGCVRWCLNVKVDNIPALRLYERVGLRPAHRSTALRLPWSAVARLPRGRRAVTARPVDPAEDHALEAAFDLLAGQLALTRARPDRVLVRLVDPDAPEDAGVGLACFDPALPGAFPFRVAAPALAAPLLEALRVQARPEHADIQIVVEADEALAEAMRDAGAAVKLEIVHLRGPLEARDDLPQPGKKSSA